MAEWTSTEWGEPFVAVERMSRKELLAYTRRLERFMADQIEDHQMFAEGLRAAQNEGVGFPPWVDQRIARFQAERRKRK